ncbi:HNH endonuclease [Sphingomonas melonis]|uniref:HNH endonuclease n=1 Tax=Sphingomonas melonis TaxID=152682 RepID=UPI00369EF543
MRRKPLAARFAEKVVVAGPDDCWLWTGAADPNGYGRIGRGGKADGVALATHVALELSGRPRPSGLHALHSCDNPPCVNPAHLRWGTNAENVADMVGRERQSCRPLVGAQNPKAKLNDDAVRQIRASEEQGKDLAAKFGVSPAVVSKIRRRETWRHVL